MDERLIVNKDMGLLELMYSRPESRKNALLGLLWRLRMQSTVFDVFMTVCIQDLVDISVLKDMCTTSFISAGKIVLD